MTYFVDVRDIIGLCALALLVIGFCILYIADRVLFWFRLRRNRKARR